jgi:hypothetical protein
MEHFKKLGLDSAQHKPSLWLRYVGYTFAVWPHGPERLQNFHSHLSSLSPSIQFTVVTESDSAILLLYLLDIRKEMALATKVCRRHTHTLADIST